MGKGEFARRDAPPIPDADRVSTKLVARDLPTVYIQGLFPAANLAASDFPALYVGMDMLRDRFFEELRTKRNLTYAPGAWVFQRGVNVGAIYTSTPRPNEALKVMADEIRKMRTTPADRTGEGTRRTRSPPILGKWRPPANRASLAR